MNNRISAAPAVALLAMGFAANAQSPTEGEEAENMRLVGYGDLQGRSAYHQVIQHQGDWWIAYIGLHAGQHLNPLTGVD